MNQNVIPEVSNEIRVYLCCGVLWTSCWQGAKQNMIMYVTTVYDSNLGHGAAAAAHNADLTLCTVCSMAYEQCVTYPANC
jgi:hypothetical protein